MDNGRKSLMGVGHALACVTGSAILAGCIAGQAASAQAANNSMFGPNVYVVDPTMSSSEITAMLTSLSNEDQFSVHRYAILFRPGVYSVEAPVGYYEQIAGLGESPNSVTVDGFLTPNFGVPVYNTPTWPQANLTDTFWRSLENMTITPTTNSLQNAAPNTLQWGVSQGAPLRRLQINGNLQLTNSYCGNASGGFMSDLVVTGNVNPCSQQQWYTRNSSLGSWNGGVWNMVFSGVSGAPPQSYPNPPETVVATTPVSREKPFLYLDVKGDYKIFAPAAQHDTSGATWQTAPTPGRSIPMKDFLIMTPATPEAEMNLALSQGRDLLFTPGVYSLTAPVHISKPGTVVLGLGYATLQPQTGTEAITVDDVDGVEIAGLIVDAGPVNSSVLVRVGEKQSMASHKHNPTSIQDMTLRIAGATPGLATTALEVNSSDVLLDDIWAWRADHGNGVGWTVNPSAHGLVVNGNRVVATGLAVEHFQQEQVLWKGNAGQTIFYQSELPYDPPSQQLWMDNKALGYPSYFVAPTVTTHTAYGLGIYSFFNQGVSIAEENAVIVPVRTGVAIHDVGTVWLNGSGQITHVINGIGATVNSGFADQLSPVVTYP